jgi:hypothetical protein
MKPVLRCAYNLKALADSQNDSGRKGLGHALTSLWIAGLIVVPIELLWYVKLIGFTFIMIALFDYAYNISRGLRIDFVGTTSWWDKAIAKVPFGFMLFVRLICLVVGICLLLGLQDKVINIIKSLWIIN